MPQPTPNAVHVDAPLTQISVAFLQDANNFIAGQVFPTISVAKQSDRYYTYDRGFFNRDEMEVRAPGTESKGVAYEVDNIYETCQSLMDAGVTINRPPRDGRMAFVRSPDNISLELLQKGEALPIAEPWKSMENTGQW